MGIASGIFWIMVGLLYILYQAYKERPEDTVVGIILCLIVTCGIAGFMLMYKWLLSVNIALGAAFGFGGIGFVVYKLIQINIKESKKRNAAIAEYKEWCKKVDATLTEKDYENCAKYNSIRMGLSLDPKDRNYWKNEPYYSDIKKRARLVKSIEMKKAERDK